MCHEIYSMLTISGYIIKPLSESLTSVSSMKKCENDMREEARNSIFLRRKCGLEMYSHYK
jgi:hypothetical protein